jgi:hypothetical protein
MRNRDLPKVLASVLLTLACALAATQAAASAYVGITYKVDCDEYARSLHGDGQATSSDAEEAALRDSPLHIYELDRLADKCKDDSSIAKTLRAFFVYTDLQGQSSGPRGTDLTPGATTKERDAAVDSLQAKLEKMLTGFKKGDTKTLMTVLRYMVWQTDDNRYAVSACEIMARAFPENYDSLKPLTRDGSLERQAWDYNKEQWLTPQTREKPH